MHGECKTDFVLHRARCGDYSGWVNGFLHVYGSELLPRLTGDSDGMWQFPRPGGGPEPTMEAALLFSQNPGGNDTGRTQQPPHQGPILAALTAPPGSPCDRFTVSFGSGCQPTTESLLTFGGTFLQQVGSRRSQSALKNASPEAQ